MAEDPDAPQAPTSLRTRLAGWLRRQSWALPSKLAVLAALAIGLYFVLVQAPPVWPFLTTGRIYVESPGVYTRERLVNDRYSQDFWLKSQLMLLDQSKDLVRQYRLSRLQAGAATTGDAAPEPERVVLAFQDELLLRAAIRDKIRQMILENLLDDRHDLTGNSIYGLKFDTAVVPGTNTYARPYVVVRIEAETLPDGTGPGDFLADPASANNAETGGAFAATRQQYNGWRQNVESRLNGYLEQAAKAAAFTADAPATVSPASVAAPEPQGSAAAGGWNQINRARILSGLRNVLGVEAREVTFRAWPPGGPFGTLRIPEPWSRFFQIQVALSTETGGGASSCGAPFNIQLKPVFAALLLVSDQDWATFAAGASAEDKRRVLIVSSTGQEDGGQKVVIFQQARSDGGAAPEMWGPDEAEKAFAESLTGPEISRLRERADRGVACVIPTAQGEGCALRAETYVVHASQYDFVRAIAKSVPYSYAVFPRGDVEGVINDRELAAGLQAGEGSKLGLSGLQIDREVGAEPVVVNFAGGRSEAVVSGAFDFGWAIVRPGRQRPSQVSQLVLVSVPAYLDTLVLWVETGWLDRDSNPIGPPPQPPDPAGTRLREDEGLRHLARMTVALPPDYEAIDTLVVGGTRRQGPVIDDLYFAGRAPVVRACHGADILIPGERLWRSTSVTLGGQIANKITVLPDMRGIVATFESVVPPPGAKPASESAATVAVWTSEGRDDVPVPVEILVPDDVTSNGCPQATVRE